MYWHAALGRACGTVEKVSALVHSPPLEGWQAKPDGVVVKVLNNVTPIDLLAQSAVLFFNSPMLALPYRFRKFNGASGSVRGERYFREGMLALPYRFRKFNGTSGSVRGERYFREGMLALPYGGFSKVVQTRYTGLPPLQRRGIIRPYRWLSKSLL